MSGLYVKLDVNYYDDPKVTAVSTDAEVLFVRSLCYCKRLLSDGFIAVSQLPRIASDIGTDSDSESLAKELTSVGLWNDAPGGWVIAAWASHNDLAEEVEEKRRAKQEGGVLGNHKRWHQGKKGTPSPDCPYCESHTDRSTESPPTPLPSPETEVETEEEVKEEVKGGARKRATRLPDDWHPTPEPDLVDAIGGQASAAREFDKFRDYWRAKAGKDGRKLDWQGTWRNWLRRAGEDRGGGRNGTASNMTRLDDGSEIPW